MSTNVLVIAAHPDDEAIGPGGTLARHAKNGDSVFGCILCGKADARTGHPGVEELTVHARRSAKRLGMRDFMTFNFPNIRFNTVPLLEIVEAIEEAIQKCSPQIIYTHYRSDVNADHQIVSDATAAAIRLPERRSGRASGLPVIKRILAYETPSSTDWSLAPAHPFAPNVYVDIAETLEIKIAACREYEGMLRTYPHPRSEEGIRLLAQNRGMAAGLRFAEAFVLLREIH